MTLSLSSSAFVPNTTIPKTNTCDGADTSPALTWTGVPPGTKSLALIMDDPDAPPGTWVHWIVYNIPAGATGLPANVEKKETISAGAKQGLVWGVNSFDRVGYWGPCPPPGKPHRYVFKLFACDTMLTVPTKPDTFALQKAMQGHVLEQTELMGLYGR